MVKGTLKQYSITPMHITLVIATEKGEDITLMMEDDLFLTMIKNYKNINYTSNYYPYGSPDKLTCQIKNGVVTETIEKIDKENQSQINE